MNTIAVMYYILKWSGVVELNKARIMLAALQDY